MPYPPPMFAKGPGASRMLTRMPIMLRKPAEADSLAPSSGAK
jgi:hypothetical protein